MSRSQISRYLKQSYSDAAAAIQTVLEDPETVEKTAAVAEKIVNIFQNNGKVLICGNGGSACDAMHFAEEFTGRYRKNRKALPVISLTDASHITCVGNDFGFDSIFSRGVEAYGQPHDMLIGLSTSGNSANIMKAVEVAKNQEMATVTLLGKDGGILKNKADIEWIVPASTSDRVQEVHMTILHIIIEGVERILFPENY